MFILFAIAAICAAFAEPLAGISLAVVGGMYNDSSQHYRRLQSEKMLRRAWNVAIWEPFMGFIGGKKSMFDKVQPYATGLNIPKATGMPIEVLQDFAHLKGNAIDIPIIYPLIGRGVAGGEQLVGKGEAARLGTIQNEINQIRHAYKIQDTKMSKQMLTHPKVQRAFIQDGAQYLGDWFNRYLSYQPYFAFLEGFSENLTRTVGGVGKQKRSHMNLYCAGTGRVTFSTTHATYEAAVKAGLIGLTDTASDYMSTKVIENMVYAANHEHKIQPTRVLGMDLYVIVIAGAQAIQLLQDTKFQERHNALAQQKLSENPLFSGKVAGVYGGALILIDNCVPSAYVTGNGEYSNARSTTGDANGVCYGTQDADGNYDFMATPVDPGVLKPAILFGKSALTCGVASDLTFEEETFDFSQKKELGADMIFGMQCADIIDTDGHFGAAGDNKRYENVSSLVCFTYSPSAANWAA